MGRKTVLLVALLLLIGLSAWFFYIDYPEEPALAGELTTAELSWEDRSRSYLLYTPSRVAPRPPLVLVFHASAGDTAQARLLYGYHFEELAEEHGFLVAYPQGFEKHFNGCRRNGPYAANQLQVDDVGFMRALTAKLVAENGVDPAAVFATGVSNGGQMALRLALEAPDLVAAAAPVATSLPTGGNMDCTASGEPVAFLLMNGTRDPMNPYDGGTVALYGLLGDRGEVLSSEATVAYWAQLAGHTSAPRLERLPDLDTGDGSTVEARFWEGAGRAPVALYTVTGGGHNAPHPQWYMPRALGGNNRDFAAADAIWAFFASTVKP